MRAISTIYLQIGKRRWLKKLLERALPPAAWLTVPNPHFKLRVDLKDIRGPSFYVMYGGEDAFNRYERIEKLEILNILPPDGVFLDLGANIGLFSFFVALNRPLSRIYSF